MKYFVATVLGVFMLYGFLSIGAAGHGWIAGAFGFLFLAPLSFLACINAFAQRPSRQVAIDILALAILISLVVAVATFNWGERGFFDTWSHFGVGGTILWVMAYFNWVLTCTLGLRRADRPGR
jgi:hypothetical protein